MTITTLTSGSYKKPLATACSVGALSLGCSDGAVVFVDYGNTLYADSAPNNNASSFWDLDLNNDGQPDLRLRHRVDSGANVATIAAPPSRTLDVIGLTFNGFNYPARLNPGAIIGFSAAFLPLTNTVVGSLAFNAGSVHSNWTGNDPQNSGYLGIRFKIGANQHFGWVRLSVDPNSGPTPRAIRLQSAGYETDPLTPLAAIPEPGGLGLVALGAVGIASLRQRQKRNGH